MLGYINSALSPQLQKSLMLFKELVPSSVHGFQGALHLQAIYATGEV